MKSSSIKKLMRAMELAKNFRMQKIQVNQNKINENIKTISVLDNYLMECHEKVFLNQGKVSYGLYENLERFVSRVDSSISLAEKQNELIENKNIELKEKYLEFSSKEKLLEDYLKQKIKEQKRINNKKAQIILDDRISTSKGN